MRSLWMKARFRPWRLAPGLALVVSALLLLQSMVLAAPGLGGSRPAKQPGSSTQGVISSWSGQESPTALAKIDPKVQEAFRTTGQVTYLVKMRTRADVKSAAAVAREKASPAQANLMARTAVLNNLKETAERSQRSLLSDLEKMRASKEVTRFESHWIVNMLLVTSNKAVMERIAKRNDVEKIYANPKVRLITEKKVAPEAAITPSTVEWGVNRVGAPLVWQQFGIDGTGVVVSSLDTGVYGTHPALANQYRGLDPVTGAIDHTYSWFDPIGGSSVPNDGYGHGTHTMGTMVGRDPAGVNEIGVAPGAKWIAVKIFDDNGYSTGEAILAGGEWILAPGGDPSKAPDVVNNSWGGGAGIDEWFREIVIAWRAAGIVPVFAAGNDGPGEGSVSNPGNYPESLAVGATDINDGLASFSGRGPSPYGEIKPELSAPGVNIRSSVPGGDYESGWSGTSMATPHVAGVAALLRSADAGITVDEIEQVLIDSADPITNAQYPNVPNNGYGHGIVNAYTAVGMLAAGVGSVSGRVMVSGDDLTPPTINHTPVTESFKHTDTNIQAQIADNISVTAAYLRFRQPGMRWWGIADMERISGDHKQGIYSAVIPSDIAATDTIEYYIEAVDYGNNHAFSGTRQRPHVIRMLDGITPGYLQDFEGSAAGWQIAGTPEGVWEIGVPTSGPNAAYSGTRVAATNLDGNYPDNATALLISPPVDLTSGPALLRFHHWYALEYGWDSAVLAVTADGGQNWAYLGEYTGSNGAYEEAVFDLTPYAGNPALVFAWVLFSDYSVNLPGWYIDDVEIYRDTQAPAAPTNLTAAATAAGSIALTWDPVSAGDLASYKVYRSQTSGSGYAAIGSTSAANFIDASPVAGTTYYYVVTAIDAFGNESARSNEASATAANATVAFFDDMEGGPGAWSHSGENDPWEWGVPTYGPSGAASGANVWATALGGNYPNYTNAALITPPVNLTGLSTISLQYAQWYSLEPSYDSIRVEITNDGGATWTALSEYSMPGWDDTPVGWEYPLIDLSAYAGQTVQVGFRLISDGSVTYPGLYIDDVRISGVPGGGTGLRTQQRLSVQPAKVQLKQGKKPVEPKHLDFKLPSSKGKPFRLDKATGMGTLSLGKVRPMSLPAEGTVTVLETGRVVRTNPADGSYQITLPAGVYTLRAEAYGYYPQDRQVEILDGQDVPANFILEPLPHALIRGSVTSVRDGSPIEGATAWVAEDLRIRPVTSDAGGNFTLDVLAGAYTLEVRSPGYYPVTIAVEAPADGRVDVAIALEPFVGMPGELGYDDGVAESAWAFYDAGNGWAVRMTPQQPGQTTMITAARFYLWDETWPQPGGNSFRAAIFGAKPDGTPGSLLAGPIVVTDAVRGAWNEVDFSALGVAVTGDFYVAFLQDREYPNIPGLGFDTSSRVNHTWALSDGNWAEWDAGDNAMIRAVVSYGVGAPTILEPTEGAFLNNPQVMVRGTSAAGTIVTVYVDGTAAVETPAAADGTFAAEVTLAEGEHILTATATVPGEGAYAGTTSPSAPVHVIVDLTLPQLNVTDPVEGAVLSNRLITVSGEAMDAYLAGVTVNGVPAVLQSDGKFSVEIIGQPGPNLLSIVAADRAGNTSTIARNVVVDNVPPVLSNLEPAVEQNLEPGNTLSVSFDSEPGLALAAFKLVVGVTAARAEVSDFNLQPGEIAMTESSPGHYTGSWTIPANISLTTAYVEFRAVDPAGNTTRVTAPGVIHIAPPAGPHAVIDGPTTGRIRTYLNFSGTGSSSPNGPIVRYRWDMGNGRTYTTPTVRAYYTRTGTYTVTLTVTDSTGATATTTLQLTITSR